MLANKVRQRNSVFVITTTPEELTEGLFGQIYLAVFEILPYLEENKIFPAWNVRSLKYGEPPDYTVIPGLLDLNYTPPNPANLPERKLSDLRLEHVYNLGGDWNYVSNLWNKYFKFPARIYSRADSFGDLTGALALHYRGMDKNQDLVQTNPVPKEDYLALADDFLSQHPEIKKIFVATDEPAFLDQVKQKYSDYTIVQTGQATYWKDAEKEGNLRKGDHAVLDCILLSRCSYLIKCQSALSGFAKVLNPKLNAYRVSANKLFYYDIPYFPDGYVDPYVPKSWKCKRILARTFKDDWKQNAAAVAKYGKTFGSVPREEMMRKNIPAFPTIPPSLRDRVMGKARRVAKKILLRG
jgi:hypothetical protein